MKCYPFRVFFFTIILFSAWANFNSAAALEDSPRSLVHLLDYLAADYGGAVQNGKVLDKGEYQEQEEFAAMALEISGNLSKDAGYLSIEKGIANLKKLIGRKADAIQVATLAQKLKSEVLRISQLPVAPADWPNLASGKKIYETRCSSCHGAKGGGDGALAGDMDPRPRNFLDDAIMRQISPFHAFNVVRLGIPGTSMIPFPDLSDRDIWDASFYVFSLRFKDEKKQTGTVNETASLTDAANLSEVDLEKKLLGDDTQKKMAIASLRLKSKDHDDGSSLSLARAHLLEAEKAYSIGDKQGARKWALSAYLEGIEPVEPQLRAIHPKLVSDLEKAMAGVRTSIEGLQPIDFVHQNVLLATAEISKAEKALSEQVSSPWMVFSMAAGIVFREGFEAILIILAILGVVRGAGARRAALAVHGGWSLAVLLGVVAWFFSGWMLVISGAQRELSEGIASLFAVIVLLYMGFWLHNKTEIRRWTAFIDGKVRRSLEGSGRWGLFALAFIAVFREALETVLFMRALTLQGDQATELAMFAGVAISFICIFMMAWAFLKFSVNLPMRKLFAISSWLMVALSIILVGKGLHSFQEMGFLSMTSIPLPLEIPFVGIFSTLETLGAQVATLLICAVVWLAMNRPTPTLSSPEISQ